MLSSSQNGVLSQHQYATFPMPGRSSLQLQTRGLASRRRRCPTSSNGFAKLTARRLGPSKGSDSDYTSPRNIPSCWAVKLPSKASRIRAQLSQSRYPVKLPVQLSDFTGEPLGSDFYHSTIFVEFGKFDFFSPL